MNAKQFKNNNITIKRERGEEKFNSLKGFASAVDREISRLGFVCYFVKREYDCHELVIFETHHFITDRELNDFNSGKVVRFYD